MDEDKRLVSAVDFYFIQDDGERFKVSGQKRDSPHQAECTHDVSAASHWCNTHRWCLLPPPLKVKEVMFSPLSVCLSVFVCRISQKFCTDPNKILWTGSVFDKDKLIRFWWRSGCGSDYQNFWSDSSPLRDGAKNDIWHDISKMYLAQYVLLDQALHGGGMRSTECPSRF